MTELKVTAEPGVPQILTEREFDAPRELDPPRIHGSRPAGAMAGTARATR